MMALTKRHKQIIGLLLEVIPLFLAWLSRVSRALGAREVRALRTQVRKMRNTPSMENALGLVQLLQGVITAS